ncbi:MAG: OmpA family protein [Bacteroidetes bacterium]|nr:OmpA family protein [Bacteroidota bacterium]
MTKPFLLLTATITTISLLTSCVSSGRYHASLSALQSARDDSARLANKVADQQKHIGQLDNQVSDLNKRVDDLTKHAGELSTESANRQNALKKTQADLDANKKELAANQKELADRQKRLEQLQALMDQQKKAITDIRKKMSDALVGFNSNELTVSIKNGKVYVSLQENLLFPSGSAVVNPKGKEALGKLAGVLNNNQEITVDIEGHTDSNPIHGRYQDNWDLSTARATAIVRILTVDYKVDPTRVIASGHSQFDPVQSNTTADGRAQNRRTEIILSPRLDELYRLIESSPGSASK